MEKYLSVQKRMIILWSAKLYSLESKITIPNISSTWQDPTTSRADDIEDTMKNLINNQLVPSGQMKDVCTYIQELEE